MEKFVQVLLVDDHAVVRAGFSRLLDTEKNIKVVAEAESSETALNCLRSTHVDVVVTDINLPGIDGISAISRMKKLQPKTKVAILSIHETEPFISKSFEAGADAYLSKRCAPEELSTAINEIFKGNSYMSSDIARHLAFGKIDGESDKIKSLTSREYEIFRLLARGFSINEVAEKVHISPKTGYAHRNKILAKLEVTTTFELSQIALRHNIA